MHVVVSRKEGMLKFFAEDGTEIFTCPAGTAAVNSGEAHDGQCPLGDYLLGHPEVVTPPEVAYGFWFTPLIDYQGLWNLHHRAGIGIHGGGSDQPNPLADDQGLEETFGCIRLLNKDNKVFVTLVQHYQAIKQIISTLR